MSDDEKLKQAVLDELAWEPSVNAAHIGVTGKDGIVSLMGRRGESVTSRRSLRNCHST